MEEPFRLPFSFDLKEREAFSWKQNKVDCTNCRSVLTLLNAFSIPYIVTDLQKKL
jgi:hypothetical protein